MTKKLVWAVLLVFLAGIAFADAKLAGLDGTSWAVEVNPDGMAKDKGEKDYHETLTFADGKLVTNEGPKVGFQTAPYTFSRSGEKNWSFSAEQYSAAQGKYVWTGTTADGDIRGKLVWTKTDGSVLTYSFKGDKKD